MAKLNTKAQRQVCIFTAGISSMDMISGEPKSGGKIYLEGWEDMQVKKKGQLDYNCKDYEHDG